MGLPNFCYQKSISRRLSKVALSFEIWWFIPELYHKKRMIATISCLIAFIKTPLKLMGVSVAIWLELSHISTTSRERLRSLGEKERRAVPAGKSIARWEAFRQTPSPKTQKGLARLDYHSAKPGGAVNGGALVRRSSGPLTAPTGVAIV